MGGQQGCRNSPDTFGYDSKVRYLVLEVPSTVTQKQKSKHSLPGGHVLKCKQK